MNSVVEILSTGSAYAFGIGAIYTFLDLTIGRLNFLSTKEEWNGLQPKDFVFLLLGLLVMLFVFKPI